MPRRIESPPLAATVGPPRLSRAQSLEAMLKLWDKAGAAAKPPLAKLELRDADVYVGKGGVKALVVELDDAEVRKLTGRQVVPYGKLLVDDHKKQVYLQDWHGNMGPYALPKGVSFASLTDPGRMPASRTDYQKAIASLAKVVHEGLPEALRDGHTQLDFKNGKFVAPGGERLQHHYIKDHTDRIPGGAVMVGKKEFWVELIPGVSGDCLGPFPLPKGFDAKSLVEKAERAPRRPRANTDDYSSDRGASGVDSSRGFPDSLGRRGAGGSGSGYAWGGTGGNLWGGGGGGAGGGGS